MIKRELRASGVLFLQSSVADWELFAPIEQGEQGEFRTKAFINIGQETIELNILIDKFLSPYLLGENMWMLKGYLLNNEKRIPIVMFHFSEINKTFYVFMPSEEKRQLPPSYKFN